MKKTIRILNVNATHTKYFFLHLGIHTCNIVHAPFE